ncbi:nuclear transport factor 2 family protein, partial [Lonsdalea populi]
MQDFPQNFKPRDFSISEIIPHNDSVLVLGRFRHIVLSTGNAVGSDMIIHFKVSGSKIIRYQVLEGPALLAGLLMPVMNGSFS